MPRGTARQATIHLEGAQQGHADDEARLRLDRGTHTALTFARPPPSRPFPVWWRAALQAPKGSSRASCYSTRRAQIWKAGWLAHAHQAASPPPLPPGRQLGYKQELRRELNLLRNFAVSFGLLSMLTGEPRRTRLKGSWWGLPAKTCEGAAGGMPVLCVRCNGCCGA